jgi:hypothetical protein
MFRGPLALLTLLPICACSVLAGLGDYAGPIEDDDGGGGNGGAGLSMMGGGGAGGQGGSEPVDCVPWSDSFHSSDIALPGNADPTIDVTAIVPLPNCGAIVVVTSGAPIAGMPGQQRVNLEATRSVVLRYDGDGTRRWETSLLGEFAALVNDAALGGSDLVLVGQTIGEVTLVHQDDTTSTIPDAGHAGFILRLDVATGLMSRPPIFTGDPDGIEALTALHVANDGAVTFSGWFDGSFMLGGAELASCSQQRCGIVVRQEDGAQVLHHTIVATGSVGDGSATPTHVDVDETGTTAVGGVFEGIYDGQDSDGAAVFLLELSSDFSLSWDQVVAGINQQRLHGMVYSDDFSRPRIEAVLSLAEEIHIPPGVPTPTSPSPHLATLSFGTVGPSLDVGLQLWPTTQTVAEQAIPRLVSARPDGLLLAGSAGEPVDFNNDATPDVGSLGGSYEVFWLALDRTSSPPVFSTVQAAATFDNAFDGQPNAPRASIVAERDGWVFIGGSFPGQGNPVTTTPAVLSQDAFVDARPLR